MTLPKLEVPAAVRETAEKAIEQAEKAFGAFMNAASKSIELGSACDDGNVQECPVGHGTKYEGCL